MPCKDPAKRKEKAKEYREKHKEQIKEKKKEYREKHKEQIKEKRKEYNETNKEKIREKQKEYYEKNKEYESKSRKYRKRCAIDSITAREILDRYEWDLWYNRVKSSAKDNKKPYSEDFTSDVMFEMMVQGCFYCGDIATTIDRIDSKLDHTPDNCVGCCYGCNMSKGVADPATFIRKAYYRMHEKYYDDDTDIWFINKTKPRMCDYKNKANNKGVSFELTKEYFDELIKGKCAYCKRSPTTWFGIDRVVPSEGYVLGNAVSCCYDCNVDKLEDDVESMRIRNERIAARVDAGELVIKECEKVILHTGRVV